MALVFVAYPGFRHADTAFKNPYEIRTKTTTVEKVTGARSDAPKTTTTLAPRSGGRKKGKTTTTVTERPGVQTERVTTTAPEDESLTERSLSDGGLLLLRLGVALIAAFLAGAVTQRIWLGRYAIKIGTLELSEVGEAADASKEAIAALRESLEQQIAKLKDAMDKEFTDQDETARASLQSVHASMTDLYAGLNDLRKRAG